MRVKQNIINEKLLIPPRRVDRFEWKLLHTIQQEWEIYALCRILEISSRYWDNSSHANNYVPVLLATSPGVAVTTTNLTLFSSDVYDFGKQIFKVEKANRK